MMCAVSSTHRRDSGSSTHRRGSGSSTHRRDSGSSTHRRGSESWTHRRGSESSTNCCGSGASHQTGQGGGWERWGSERVRGGKGGGGQSVGAICPRFLSPSFAISWPTSTCLEEAGRGKRKTSVIPRFVTKVSHLLYIQEK